jgi:hypothetical protein
MKHAALGFRMHSGWGGLVGLSANDNSVDVTARRHIVTADPKIPGARQPYHYASCLTLSEAEEYLAKCAAASESLSLAFEAIEDVVRELEGRDYRLLGSAVLLAAGRPLPLRENSHGAFAHSHGGRGVFSECRSASL